MYVRHHLRPRLGQTNMVPAVVVPGWIEARFKVILVGIGRTPDVFHPGWR